MIGNAQTNAKDHVQDVFKDASTYPPISYIRLYSVYARTFQKLLGTPSTRMKQARNSPLPQKPPVATLDDKELEHWSALWEAMHPAIARYWNKSEWTLETIDFETRNNTIPPESPEVILAQDRELAEDCLCRMQEMEDASNPGHTADRPPVFSDKLVTAVGLFVLPERVHKFPRLQLLQFKESPSVSDAASIEIAVESVEVEGDASDDEGGESEVSDDEEVESEVNNYEEWRAG